MYSTFLTIQSVQRFISLHILDLDKEHKGVIYGGEEKYNTSYESRNSVLPSQAKFGELTRKDLWPAKNV